MQATAWQRVPSLGWAISACQTQSLSTPEVHTMIAGQRCSSACRHAAQLLLVSSMAPDCSFDNHDAVREVLLVARATVCCALLVSKD